MSCLWGIVPAAGLGTRIQPLAFSKELLPVGMRHDGKADRPRAVCEYLLERMLEAAVTRICFVISPSKTDIVNYFGGRIGDAAACYAIQGQPSGLCDALFTAVPFIAPDDEVLIGLPDTIWFPADGFCALPDNQFSFLLFPVEEPELFDAVITDDMGRVQEVQVKQVGAASNWVWGAFKLKGRVLARLHELWLERQKRDQYWGTLVNAYIGEGGVAIGVRHGEKYIDVGTLRGYHEAVRFLSSSQVESHGSPISIQHKRVA